METNSMGIVEDACEALLMALSLLKKLLDGPIEFQEKLLLRCIEMNLWTKLHEMIATGARQ